MNFERLKSPELQEKLKAAPASIMATELSVWHYALGLKCAA